jgi:nitroreductase
MADGYLEDKMESFLGGSHKTNHIQPSLTTLLRRNRSYRGYDGKCIVAMEHLRKIIAVNTLLPSARNQQVLRFRPVLQDEAPIILEHIHLGGALKELHLPFPGTEPLAFIVICSTVEESKYVDIDLGISVQSMLLRATEMGLNGLCIGAFEVQAIQEALNLPSKPLLILAIGKGSEHIELTEIGAAESHAYYRQDGVQYVPKVRLDELIINK